MTKVITKCSGCGKKREIGAGEVPEGEIPMCDECYMPMIAVGVAFPPKRKD